MINKYQFLLLFSVSAAFAATVFVMNEKNVELQKRVDSLESRTEQKETAIVAAPAAGDVKKGVINELAGNTIEIKSSEKMLFSSEQVAEISKILSERRQKKRDTSTSNERIGDNVKLELDAETNIKICNALIEISNPKLVETLKERLAGKNCDQYFSG